MQNATLPCPVMCQPIPFPLFGDLVQLQSPLHFLVQRVKGEQWGHEKDIKLLPELTASDGLMDRLIPEKTKKPMGEMSFLYIVHGNSYPNSYDLIQGAMNRQVTRAVFY